MSTTTSNLGLFKYTEADHDKAFDYKEALNQNWDIIDEVLQEVENTYVPKTTTINNKALSSNISLTPSDVGAAASSHNQASNTINTMTGYSKPSSTSAIAATDSLNTAIGKLEKALDGKSSSDTLMTQNVSSTNGEYPLLACPTASATTNQGAKTGLFASTIRMNPSTGVLQAPHLLSNGTGFAGFTCYRATTSSDSAIRFSNKTETTGYIGMSNGKIPRQWLGSDPSKWYRLLRAPQNQTTAVGGPAVPCYIDANGIAQACTSINVPVTGTVDSATKDGAGNVITDTYQLKSTAVTHSNNTAVGSTTKPVYIANNGTATEIGYTIQTSVPANAVFTDTKNTAGSTDTSSKIFLVGATSQGANPQTYSHDTAFVDTSGQLNSANPASTANSTIVATTKWVTDKGFLTSVPNIASNKVTAMTGYSKPSTTSAIETTDSLNTAIGKLEKALDGKATTDTKVTNTLNNTVKAYITGTTSNATNTGTQVFDSNVYLSATAGELVATKFTGALNGNASTATKATQDSDGNAINSTYLKKSGGTMTGALNFANNTWNNIGDDAKLGDHNVGGHICIKPSNSSFDNSGGISFHNSSDTALVQLNASSGALTSSGSLGVSNNACKMVYNSTTQALEFNFA